MKKAVIVAAARTAVGKFGGSLIGLGPGQLGSVVVGEVLKRATVEPSAVDEVIMGNVLSAGHGQNVARQAAIKAGVPNNVPACGVNKVCGSGLKSVVLAAQAVMLGDADVVLAGGVESMSQAPYGLKKTRWGAKMGNDEAVDLMIHDGLWDAFNDYHMGVTAENLADRYGISREEQDEFAAESQNKAEAAIQKGSFRDEIVPIELPQRKGDPVVFDTDEFPRFGSTKEALSKLRPVFKKDGTVTAGNASGINDGAAAVLVMSEKKADELGLAALATIESYGSAGVSPEVMGIGPVGAVGTALERAGVTKDDLELVELNEAFAVQSIAVARDLGLDRGRLNVNGGAIALGHPIGASGTRLLVTLLYELARRGGGVGLAALCIGGGQGIAMVVRKETV